MVRRNEQRNGTERSPDSFQREADFNGINLPQKGIEKALQGIIPEVAKRLATLTPDNVLKEREFIFETVAQVEGRLLYAEESKVVNLLKNLRAVALAAFVRSFEVAPPSSADLVKFCLDYVPDPRLKKGSDTTIKVKGLTAEIEELSQVGAANVRHVVGEIQKGRRDRLSAEKILMYLKDNKKS